MAKKYDNLSKEDLIRILERRDNERKLGLVWEREQIDPDNTINDDFPLLQFREDLSIGVAPYNNMIIEGDNYDALRFLGMTLTGKVKVILIDPPYNVGDKDFIYNDRFASKDDRFFYSTWLEFMYKRLILARNLLKEDGVIFVHINDKTMPYLSLLMEQVFPGKRVGTFVWKCRTGANDSKNYFLSEDHEYVLCYANPKFTFAGIAKDDSAYTNPDNDPRGIWTTGDLSSPKNLTQRPNTYYHIKNPDTGVWYPCNPSRVWAFATKHRIQANQKLRNKTIEQLIEEKRVLFPENDETVTYYSLDELKEAIKMGTAPAVLSEVMPDLDFFVGKAVGYGRPQNKRFFSELKKKDKPLSTWIVPTKEKINNDEEDLEYIQAGLTSEGTRSLKNILGQNVFSYPKPPSLIRNLIEQATTGVGEEIILDFFAGSGTTAQAVLELNAEQDEEAGRKFILVSSTEASKDEPDKNICRKVTRLRVSGVINGYEYRTQKGIQTVEGTGGDFAYYITTHIPEEDMITQLMHEEVWTTLQLIHFNSVSPLNEKTIIQVRKEKRQKMAYVLKGYVDVIKDIKNIAKDKVPLIVYTWQPKLLSEYIDESNIVIEKIPECLISRFGGRIS